MFDRRSYRDQVILPAQRDPAAREALERAARAVNAARGDSEVVAAMASIDAARLFAIPTDADDAQIAEHLDQVASFLRPGKPPITVVLSALLKSIRTQHSLPTSVALWTEVRQRSAQGPSPAPSAAAGDNAAEDLYAVRRYLSSGNLTAAKQALEQLLGDDQAANSPLLTETKQAVAAAESARDRAITRYRTALTAEDFSAAEDALLTASRLDRGDHDLTRLLDQLPAPPPVGVTASSDADGVHVRWVPAPTEREIRYQVFRQPEDGPSTPLTTPDQVYEFHDQAPPFGPLRYVIGSSVGRTAAATHSAEVGITHAPPPDSVTVSTTEAVAEIGWRCPPGADQVTVRLKKPAGAWQELASTTKSSIRIHGLRLGETYLVELIASYPTDSGRSVLSEPIATELVPSGPPTAPTDFTVQPVQLTDGSPGLHVRWPIVVGHPVELWSLALDSTLINGPITRRMLEAEGTRIPADTYRSDGYECADLDGMQGPRCFMAVVWDGELALTGPVRSGACLPVPQQPRQTRMGSEVLLSWHWPTDCILVSAWWAYSDGTTEVRELDQHTYRREGGLRIPDPAGREITARLSSVHRQAGQEFHSVPAEVTIPAEPPMVSYRLKLSALPFGPRRATVEFSGGHHGTVPMVAILSRGKFLAACPQEGEILDRFTVDLGSEVSRRATFPVPRVKGPHSIRLFAAVEGLIRLVDPPTDTLKG